MADSLTDNELTNAGFHDITPTTKEGGNIKVENVNGTTLDNDVYVTKSPHRNGTSLFNKYALIDYGRFIGKHEKWEHYNGTGTFKINNKETYSVDRSINDELNVLNLITALADYTALKLTPQDFAYCQRLGYYPNNRLVILRRFKSGVPDNLFDYVNLGDSESTAPMSTLVTWMKPDDKIMTMKYNENWSPANKGGIISLFKDILTTKKGAYIDSATGNTIINTISSIVVPIALESKIFGDGYEREDGLSWIQADPYGDPNLINEASVRVGDGNGLKSTVSFNITFEYELRYINGLDPSVAMLDLMSNCLRMGTSTARFMYPIKTIKNEEWINRILNANYAEAAKGLRDTALGLLNSLVDGANKMVNNALASASQNGLMNTAENIIGATGDIVKKSLDVENFDIILGYLVSRYRERFKAAFAADTGSPSGVWHVTVGNPLKPTISCGDLVLTDADIVLGSELGYNDAPTSFSCTVSLKGARVRGRDELERIFNAGRGRVYVYKNPSDNPDNFLPKTK
jgi:hypothetical protein